MVLLARASTLQDAECLRFDDAKTGEFEQQKPEKVAEDSFHGSPTYFNYSITGGGMMLRTVMSTVLNNALNNSLKNYLNPQVFTPLAAPKRLMQSPAVGFANPDLSSTPITSWRDTSVCYLADKGNAYWLIDAIASYFGSPQMQQAMAQDDRLTFMQFWRLVVKGESAVLTAEADAGVEPFITQAIPFTDFPLEQIDIWAGFDGTYWTLYLPSEH